MLGIAYPADLRATHPNGDFATFRMSDPLEFDLTVTGPPGERFMFTLTVHDEYSEEMEPHPISPGDRATFDDHVPAGGLWTHRWSDVPHHRALGFYRVKVTSPVGPVVLPASGTRPANHFTYAIVPDPEDRQEVPASEAFFGLMGLYPAASWVEPKLDLASWLGARWTLNNGFSWGLVRDPWYSHPVQGESTYPPPDALPLYFHWYRNPLGPLDRGWAMVGSEEPVEPPTWRLFQMPTLFMLGDVVSDIPAADGDPGYDFRHLTDVWDHYFSPLLPGDESGPADPDTYGIKYKQGALINEQAGQRWEDFAAAAAANWAEDDGAPSAPMDLRPYEVTSEPDPNQGFRGVAKDLEEWGATEDPVDHVWRPAGWSQEAAARKQALGMLREIFFRGAAGIRAGDSEGLVLGPSFDCLHVWDEDDLPPSYYQPPEDPDTHVPLPYDPDGLKGVWYSQKQLLESRGYVNGQWRRVIDVLDAYSVHPYHPDREEEDAWPEALVVHGEDDPRRDTIPLRDAIDRVRQGLADLEAEGAGRTLDLYATEFGWPTMGNADNNGAPELDLAQARAQIRQNLILLGEGFKVGISHLAYDRFFDPGLRMGFYYNPEEYLDSNGVLQLVGYPTTLSPRPLAPAYAAMTWLLEGLRSLGRLVGLENSDDKDSGTAHQYGYLFHGPPGTLHFVVALWDWFGESEVWLPLGVPFQALMQGKLDFFDWMGNPIYPSKLTDAGQVVYRGAASWGTPERWQIRLSPEPIYVRVQGCGVPPLLVLENHAFPWTEP